MRMVQFEKFSGLLNKEGNIPGLTVSKAFSVFVCIIETVHSTLKFLSELNNAGLVPVRFLAIPVRVEICHW